MVANSRKKSTTKTRAKAKSSAGGAAKKKSSSSKNVLRSSAAGKHLVIVESPAKARTVGQILGNKYLVTASQGHVRDLPKSKIGVDIDQGFEPSYVIMQSKRSIVNDLKKAGEEAASIYLAT